MIPPLTDAENTLVNHAFHRLAIVPANSAEDVEKAFEFYLGELIAAGIIQTSSATNVDDLDDVALIANCKALACDVDELAACSTAHLRLVREALRRRDPHGQRWPEFGRLYDELARRIS